MEIDQTEINSFVLRPSETRSAELKAWIDPRTVAGKAKLVRALLALRNFNGGRLLIGFDNDTLQALPENPPGVIDAFTNDYVQGLVSKHASEPFDIVVCFGELSGQRYPVIVVESGIRTPVAVKAPITDVDGHQIVDKGVIFFRSLNASGVVSSAPAQPADWPEIMQICMDNREADIGRFVRRHLSGLDLSQFAGVLGTTLPMPVSQPSLKDLTNSWLNDGASKFPGAISRWPRLPYEGDRPDIAPLLKLGSWEVALAIDPPVMNWAADKDFYRRVASNVPEHSSWPIWSDFSSFSNPSHRPVQTNEGWETLVVSTPQGMWDHLEFQRWEPNGRFYLRRLHDDDASAKVRGAQPGLLLDLGLVASRVAEAMIAGLSITKALRWSEETTRLGFAFRWTGLEGRRATFFLSGLRYVPAQEQCIDSEAVSFVTLPLATAHSAVTPYVGQATRSLFAKFAGFSMSSDVLEGCVRMVLEHKT